MTNQFFIWFGRRPPAGTHTFFGRVVEGMDVVKRIAAMPADAECYPLQRVTIRKAVRLPRS